MEQRHHSARPQKSQRSIELEITSARYVSQVRSAARHTSPRARFPAMFWGPHLGLTLYRGWNPILAAACGEIEDVLSHSALAFHWVQIEEEAGVARFLYSLGERSRYVVELAHQSRRAMVHVTHDAADDLAGSIDRIVNEAERLTSESCMVCGARAVRAPYFGRELPLCPLHQPEKLNGQHEEGLEGLWRHSIEWEAR